MKKTYDVLVIGPVSLDHNIDYQGNERKGGGRRRGGLRLCGCQKRQPHRRVY